jgi:uncharacterized protein YkwD
MASLLLFTMTGGGEINMSWLTRMPTLLFATLLATQVGTPTVAADTILDQREQFVLSEINRIRAEQGLSQLRLNDKLCAIARNHSSNMAEYGYLSHIDSLGRDFSKRVGSRITAPYHAGENVARNNFPNSAQVAVQGWSQSPSHLKNILNENFAETGVGVVVNSEGSVFFTQIFLGK